MEEQKEKGSIRAFICVKMPDSVIKEVARIDEVFGNWKFTGKFTELENLHLTLKFLGEINIDKIEKIIRELRKIEFKEFEARLSEIGTFNFRGKPKIVWIKIGGKDIFELQKEVDNIMEKEGFTKEERFMSHMSIARVKYAEDKNGFLEYVKGIGIKDIKFKVDRFYLMKSELHPDGPVYSVIEEYAGRREEI